MLNRLLDGLRKGRRKTPEKAKQELQERGISYDESSFFRAAEEGRADVVNLFVQSGMSVDAADPQQNTALMKAVTAGQTGVVQSLIESGATVNQKDAAGRTALIRAVLEDRLEAASVLCAAAANLNATDQEGNPALIHAIRSGRIKVAETLIRAGANVDVRDNSGFSAVMLAVRQDQFEILEMLINAGADVNVKNHETQETALIMAARAGNLQMVELLLRNAITSEDRDARDKTGKTALAWSVLQNHKDVVELLCERKANPNIADSNGQTPLEYAEKGGNEQLAAVLIKAGAGKERR